MTHTSMPNMPGRHGPFGGRYVSELLMPALQRLETAWSAARTDPEFLTDWRLLLQQWAGRPTPLCPAPALSQAAGCRVLLKREDLLHGGAHKTNNTLGQALLAKRMGMTRLIAETGAGQHGVATAMAGARLGLPVTVFMGAKDVARQAPNVLRMRLLGAEIRPVTAGSASLKDAINEAMRHWTQSQEDTFYLFGTAAGPHPYPEMVKFFQSVISEEIRHQAGELPAGVVACVGGGSNAIGAFAEFIAEPTVRLVGVEAAGKGLESGQHGATLTRGRPGIVHGMRTMVLQDGDGQIMEAHSISAGLDYPAVGPEHAWLAASGRAQYVAVTDAEALAALVWLTQAEGIIPALESSHAIAWLLRGDHGFAADDTVVLCLSGRGDKDLAHVAAALESR
jgi:tryptophan synthase beta chain